MALFDLPLAELEKYRPTVRKPADFDHFWTSTLDDAARFEPLIAVDPITTGLALIHTWDIAFAGYAGHPIRAWYSRPAGTQGHPLPVVVEYPGYGRGRGLPVERLLWPSAGYAHLLVDTRGQGGQYGNGGDTPDPVGSAPSAPGFLTRGIGDPGTAYLRRLLTDAARAVDAALALPDVESAAVVGNSQGGGLAIAAAGLNNRVDALLASAPLLCQVERAIGITDAEPYNEIVRYLSVHRRSAERVLNSLSYFDGVHFAGRTTAPALFATGLRDTICPPSGVFAAFNALGTPLHRKEIAVYPYNHHEGGDAHHVVRQLSWMNDHLPV
ncbi:acetylxylan esterase [Umezawaea tangerina]|uniref:Cephalosporin-C deacetylase n=1 Tax=Umezawaea tangerina TaxID=84725 RepID=A0A2T0TFV6_9PSEU|nr:acetylxylan esterase [Umezawaea tangerina]PRY44521.1 cephalosporin-C deacetylase [Umezawaea tangerina]